MQATDRESIEQQVEDEFSCDHQDTCVVLSLASNNAKMYRNQCQRCGWTSRYLKHITISAAERDNAPDYDENSIREWQERKAVRRAQLFTEALANHFDPDSPEHIDYYDTPAWKQKRELVLKRAGYICEGCRVRRAVQAHHLIYEHFGDEFLFECVAVCIECHQAILADRRRKFAQEKFGRI